MLLSFLPNGNTLLAEKSTLCLRTMKSLGSMFKLIRMFIHSKKQQYCNDLEVPHALSFPFLFNMGFLAKHYTVRENECYQNVLNGSNHLMVMDGEVAVRKHCNIS